MLHAQVAPSRPTNEYFLSRKYIRLQNIKRSYVKATLQFLQPFWTVFFCIFKKVQDPPPETDSLVRGTETRIRIRIKMSRIRNTCPFHDFSCPSQCMYTIYQLFSFFFYISTNISILLSSHCVLKAPVTFIRRGHSLGHSNFYCIYFSP